MSFPHPTRSAARILLHVAVSALLTSACDGRGDRLSSPAERCPDGETCSSRVEGLYFHDPGVTMEILGSALHPIVVGGTSVISVSGEGDDPWPFDAGMEPSGPSGPMSARAVDGQALVTAAAEGEAKLRITEPGGGPLLDRVTLSAAPVASARVALVQEWPTMQSPTGQPWVIFVGASAPVEFGLFSPIGSSLVDTSATISGAGLAPPGPKDPWFRRAFDAPAVAGDVALTVVSGGRAFEGEVRVVDAIDDVVTVPAHWAGESGWSVCFFGAFGGQPVFGAPLTISTTVPGATVADACVDFDTSRPWLTGTLTVTSAIGTQTHDVLSSDRESADRAVAAAPVAPGDRAAAALQREPPPSRADVR